MSREGFREVEHTADWGLEVWGPDLPAVFRQAALGMNTLMGVVLAAAPRQRRTLELAASDPEGLLVEFLGELLYLAESEGLAFDRIEVEVAGDRLVAWVEGAPVATLAKEIKAVTYHWLELRETARGLETRIVFDV